MSPGEATLRPPDWSGRHAEHVLHALRNKGHFFGGRQGQGHHVPVFVNVVRARLESLGKTVVLFSMTRCAVDNGRC